MTMFRPGIDSVPYAGRVFDHREKDAAHRAVDAFWLTEGYECQQFEKELAATVGAKRALLTNSGSSANLLAVASLKLQPGDEVITCALGFPTTAAPIIQTGGTAVFVDCDPGTLNIDWHKAKLAITPKTRAIIAAHTLGNPFEARILRKLCDDNGLVLIEDNCDALGSKLGGQWTGSFGNLATQSFYPAHHITTGEGGAVLVNDFRRATVASFRDWGRHCWCDTGCEDTCGKRFGWKFEGMPVGYDHKYVYSELGYNLKMTEVQAAIGRVQLTRLAEFTRKRHENWQALADGLGDIVKHQQPTHGSDPSWFGFAFEHRDRDRIARGLAESKIGCRMPFGGNLTRQPAFAQYRDRWRVHGALTNTDRVMEQWLFVGVYPGITEPMREYVVETVRRLSRP